MPNQDVKTPELAEQNGPDGLEMQSGLSFRRLNPLAGSLAKDTGEPQLCGWITGIAGSHKTDPKGKFGEFVRIYGEFFGVSFTGGTQVEASEVFLPPVAERWVCAMLDQAGDSGNGVPFAFEGWAYPMEEAPRGYAYRVFRRQIGGQLSAARRLAIAAGIIAAPLAPPSPALELPEHDLGASQKPRDGLEGLLAAE